MPDVKSDLERLSKLIQDNVVHNEAEIEKMRSEGKGIAELAEKSAKMSKETAALIESVQAKIEKEAQEREDLKKALNERQDEFEAKYGKGGRAINDRKGLADAIIETMKAAQESTGNPTFNKEFDGYSIARKDVLLSNNTSTPSHVAALEVPFYDPDVVTPPAPRFTMRNLIPSVRTTASVIHFRRKLPVTDDTTNYNKADYVAEGAAKPKSELGYETDSVNVVKLAHHFRVSTEAAEDIPRLLGDIQIEGVDMLKLIEDRELQLGDGTTGKLKGFISQATGWAAATTAAYGTVSNPTILDKLRASILQVHKSGYPVNGFVMSPDRWFQIETLKDTENRYLISSATDSTPGRVWGIGVSEGFSLPVDFATDTDNYFVGAFAAACVIYDRWSTRIDMGYAGNDFTENMFRILIEERLALAVKDPNALVKDTFALS